MTRDQIRSAALELDAPEREALAEELLLSIGSSEREAIDAAWLSEVRRRDADAIGGSNVARPVDEVVNRLQRRAAQ
jgi:hypothetical protein